MIDGLSAREIRSASRKGVSAETLRSLFAEPDLDSSELAVSAEEMALSTMAGSAIETSRLEETVGLDAPSPARASARREALVSASRAPGEVAGGSGRLRGRRWPSSGEGEEERRVGQLLAEIDRSAGRGAKPSEGRTRERVTRVPVTEDIFVSVRNMSEEHAELVEELAERLRRLGRLD